MEILSIILSIIILIFSAVLHEVAHGFVAYRLGDPTAKHLGRLTLNPIKHLDPVMSVLIPLTLILSGSQVILGGAKPVPVDPFNLRDGKKDLALVSLVGPLTNLVIAILASLVLHLLFSGASLADAGNSILGGILFLIIRINIFLAIFNLIPIPPLDGSKVVAMILPDREAAAYLSLGSIGMLVIFALLYAGLGAPIYALSTFALSLLGF